MPAEPQRNTGGSVVCADTTSNQLVFFDKATGLPETRVDVDLLLGVAGVDGDTVFVATHPSSSNVVTEAMAPSGDLSGYTINVYQRSSTFGRGYPATLEL